MFDVGVGIFYLEINFFHVHCIGTTIHCCAAFAWFDILLLVVLQCAGDSLDDANKGDRQVSGYLFLFSFAAWKTRPWWRAVPVDVT